MKLSEYIINYRKRMGLSQRRLAMRCNLSNAYLSMLENEKNPTTGEAVTPSIESLAKLAYGMGITLQQLMEEVDDCQVDISPNEMDNRHNEILLQNLSNDERTLFRLAKTATPDAIKAAIAVLKTLEETNHEF